MFLWFLTQNLKIKNFNVKILGIQKKDPFSSKIMFFFQKKGVLKPLFDWNAIYVIGGSKASFRRESVNKYLWFYNYIVTAKQTNF